MTRKRRAGELVCRCGAYKFPHRMMGGRCDGGWLVAETFAREIWGACRDCRNHEVREYEVVCTVMDGREALHTCEALTDHVRFNGVQLYGVNKPPERKGLRFRR